MSIETQPGGRLLASTAPLTWGETVPHGQAAMVVRFILEESVVTIPTVHFKRWDHIRGVPETLVLVTSSERVVVEGKELAAIRAALDLGRLCEIRANHAAKSGARIGPHVHRITIETA
jgi:hypothetical protein